MNLKDCLRRGALWIICNVGVKLRAGLREATYAEVENAVIQARTLADAVEALMLFVRLRRLTHILHLEGQCLCGVRNNVELNTLHQ